MEFNLDIRKKQLESLKQYIRSSEDNVRAVFHSLGWNINKTLQDPQSKKPKIQCPINKNHLITEETASTHFEKCSLASAGYTDKDQFLSEPLSDSKCNIKLSKTKKIEVFSVARANRTDFKPAWNGRDPDPLTSNRYISTYSADERLALYDYSVKHTEGPAKPEEFTLEVSDSKEKKALTEKEKLIHERDSRRRRAKYKSVHTSKKSHTEVMRELIDNQMTLYVDWIKQKEEKDRREKERLKRLAKEKMRKKSSSDRSKVQSYENSSASQTVYDQFSHTTTNSYVANETVPYVDSYSVPYPVQSVPNQGIITDWSHLYQGGIDTDIYSNLDDFQLEESSFSATSAYLTDPLCQGYPNNGQQDKIGEAARSSQTEKETQDNYSQLKEALRRGNKNLK